MFYKIFIFLKVLAQGPPPVLVTVYYESLCGDSIAFIKNQLHPTYNELSEIMIADLNAYGKASVSIYNLLISYDHYIFIYILPLDENLEPFYFLNRIGYNYNFSHFYINLNDMLKS